MALIFWAGLRVISDYDVTKQHKPMDPITSDMQMLKCEDRALALNPLQKCVWASKMRTRLKKPPLLLFVRFLYRQQEDI